MRKTIGVFALLALALLLLFKLSQYAIFRGDLRTEWTIAVVAVIFFIVGIYINKKSLSRHHNPQQHIDTKKIAELGLSKREYEVLQEISKGLSNKEIGEKLFLSESTIKTHVSNLLVKLNARRRTQAIQIAKELNII